MILINRFVYQRLGGLDGLNMGLHETIQSLDEGHIVHLARCVELCTAVNAIFGIVVLGLCEECLDLGGFTGHVPFLGMIVTADMFEGGLDSECDGADRLLSDQVVDVGAGQLDILAGCLVEDTAAE